VDRQAKLLAIFDRWKYVKTIFLEITEYCEGIAKLHSEPNLCFFRWIRFFAKCLWPRGYVTLQKIEPTKKSSNFAREASFAIPSDDRDFFDELQG